MGLACRRRLRFGLGTGIDSRLEEMTRTVRPTACIIINSNSEHTSCTMLYKQSTRHDCVYMYMYMYLVCRCIHVYTVMYLVWTVAAVEAVSHSLSATSDSRPQPA